MTVTTGSISIVIICAACNKESPFGVCDAVGCTWRAEAFAEAVEEGALTRVVCDETNNSDEDRKSRRLNVTVEAYRAVKGSA